MFQGPLKQKITFLAQKMCPPACGQTNKQKTEKCLKRRQFFKFRKRKKNFNFFLMFQGPLKQKN